MRSGLMRFYGVPERVLVDIFCHLRSETAWPDSLGHFFDTIGRKQMIAATYGVWNSARTDGLVFHAGL